MDAPTSPDASPAPRYVAKHRLATRLWHWTNAVAVFVLLGSGMTISNAHRRLYWGKYGANADPAWLGVWYWPSWLTIPSTYNLALGRRWHLFFALVFAFALLGYMVASLFNRHFQRQLRIRRDELTRAHLWADIRAHLALRFHDPEKPGAYNVLQKIAYAGTVFILFPLAILTGLTLSPGMDAAWPWLLDLFGGRQSARSIHFLAAGGIAAFIVVHLTLVILAGPVREVTSMITGRWRLAEGEAA